MIVACDGASRGNPGPAGAGAQITDPDGVVLAEVAEGLGEATNNVAEYTAVIRGLERAHELGAAERAAAIRFPTADQPAHGAVPGEVASPAAPASTRACSSRQGSIRIEFEHVRRERNTEADRLANQGVDEWLAAR